MLKSAVCCALSFFQYPARIVVLVATPEPKAAVRSGNFRARKNAPRHPVHNESSLGVGHLGRWSWPPLYVVHYRNCKRFVSRPGASTQSPAQRHRELAPKTDRIRLCSHRREQRKRLPARGGKIS